MANQNQNQRQPQGQQSQGPKVITLSEELKEQLIRMAATSHNLWGLPPSASEWTLTENQIIDIVKQQASAFLDDISYVTTQGNPRTDMIETYVWVPSNSHNIVDNSLKNNGSVITKSMRVYSKEMKEFMDKYCYPNEKRLFSDDLRSPNSGVKVNLEVALKIFFDEKGQNYEKVFGIRDRRTKKVTFRSILRQNDNHRSFHDVIGLHVRKSYVSRDNGDKPIAKKSYNA